MHEFWSQVLWFLNSLEVRNLVDIFIVAFLVYEVLRLVRGTRAVQMAVGLGLVALLYQLSSWLGLSTVQWVLRNAVVYLGFGIIVLFQHEIRAALTPKVKADKALGEWNRFRITMKGDRLTVVLNGKVVIENAQLPGIPERGPIALQHHGDPIQFPNLYIKEL